MMPAMSSLSSSDDVVILGAGPAGMAAAMELSKAGRHVTIIEKDAIVGGLAKTLVFEESDGKYRTDIGPHRFYSKNPYLYTFIEEVIGEEWKQVPRLTRFVVGGKFYLYPIRIGNLLRQLPPWTMFRMLTDYAYECVRRLIAPRPQKSFEDYVVSKFGRTLAGFNMLQYTEKIWGIPCSQTSIDWAKQRIGGLSIWTALRKAITKRGGPKTLVDTFYYPSLGTGLIYTSVQKRIEAMGAEVLTSSQPLVIHRTADRVTEVMIETPQGKRTLHPKHLISSIPITRCIHLFDPPPPPQVLESAAHLRFRSQVYLFLTIDRPSVTKDNWIYFPDKSIPFGRIAEMRNFSSHMCPPGKTSLFVEFFCFKNDPIWNATKEELFEKTIFYLEQFGFLKRTEVQSIHHFRKEHVYPLYDLSYAKHVETVLHWMDNLANFTAIGRPGRFRYTNQDHSLEMGILAARSLLTGSRFADTVGKENEYFEQGSLPPRERR